MTSGGTVMERHIKTMGDYIQQRVGQPIDIQDLFFRLTIDVFSQIAFGLELKRLRTLLDIYMSGFSIELMI